MATQALPWCQVAGPPLATLSPVAGTVVSAAGCGTGSQNLPFGVVSRLFSLA